MASVDRFLNLHDFEKAARKSLPRPIWGYVSNAAEDSKSLRGNRLAFDDYALLPRTLNDVSERSLTTTLFGTEHAAPFGIAPMGIVALSGYRGDTVLARAATESGIPSVLSASSLVPMEEVAAVAPDGWFQIYMPETRDAIEALLTRVKRCGFSKLIVTVDYPVPPNPENNIRSGFSSPLRPGVRLALDGLLRPRWLLGTFLRTLMRHGMPHFENLYASRGLPIISKHVDRDFSGRTKLNWDTLAFVREQWPGALIVKGILHPKDATQAIAAGADGLILSNHGGRQLDTAVSPLRMLPDVVQVAGDVPVMIDSGFRRGTDVLKALALGARFVFLGRPFNYALAASGQPGVGRAIDVLKRELLRDMALLGVNRVDEIDREQLIRNTRCRH